ncbi:MAG: two-component system, cell cycle response regulator [Acidobacteriota bacterium]|nr:two-component system, cell cycle response regulator [Acidobacteriota bacterium]
MSLDVTLNSDSDIDISHIDDSAYRFMLALQSMSSVTGAWELFLKVIERNYPGMMKEARLAYHAGSLCRALSSKPTPASGAKNKKKMISRELDVTNYAFAETGAEGNNEMGYRCSGEEILIFKRTESQFIQVHLFVAPLSAFDFSLPLFLNLGRIFLVQLDLLLRIETLEFHSVKDDLTLTYNQKYLRNFLQNEIERCNRYPSFFSVVFFDLDNLKAINDQYGHLIGTEVLKDAADVLKGQIRKIDLVSRFGGDEFVIVLVKADSEKAYETCKRIRKRLANTIFLKDKGLSIEMTGCFGISCFPRDGSTVDELIRKADSAMYDVKRRGKNGIKIYEGA